MFIESGRNILFSKLFIKKQKASTASMALALHTAKVNLILGITYD